MVRQGQARRGLAWHGMGFTERGERWKAVVYATIVIGENQQLSVISGESTAPVLNTHVANAERRSKSENHITEREESGKAVGKRLIRA